MFLFLFNSIPKCIIAKLCQHKTVPILYSKTQAPFLSLFGSGSICLYCTDTTSWTKTRMVQLPATAAIEYVDACCITRTRTITKTKTKTESKTRTKIRTRTKTRTKTKTGTITKIVRGAYDRSPQVQCLYAPSRLSVPSVVAWRTKKTKKNKTFFF